MKALITSTTIALIFLFAINANAQNSLTIKVDNLDDSKGTLMIALFNSEATFLSPQAQGQSAPIVGTTSEVVFDNLPDGEYAIALYQDSNNNYHLDMTEQKIPTEKYGFSNNVDPAKIHWMPTFTECKFLVKDNTTVAIKAVSAFKN